MIRGVTFDKQLMKSSDHAHEVNYYFQGDKGVTKGCNTSSNVDGNLVVSDGYFIIYGRLVKVEGNEIVVVPDVASGILYSILVFEIDLTQVNTTTEFNQGVFKIVSNPSVYPTLTQQDLSNGGNVYQMEFARFQNTVGGVVSLIDTKTLLNMSKYITDTEFDSLVAVVNNKANKSTTQSKTLAASSWTGASAPFLYTLAVTGVTTTSIQELCPSLAITQAQLDALQKANILDAGQSINTINLKAWGTKPTIDLPIIVILRGDA